MPSGWTRWLFEQYEFPFQVVYPQTLDAGDLKSKFDVIGVYGWRDSARRGLDAAEAVVDAAAHRSGTSPENIATTGPHHAKTRRCRS